MARAGYRTLVVGEKELTRSEYSSWSREFESASVALVNREDRIAEVSDKIERGLSLVGATAVEDKLQVRVTYNIMHP
jgi:phospholipid-translocating ATPase